MNLNRVYIAVIILTVLSLGFFLLNIPIVYRLYGYSPDIVGSGSFESFEAVRETATIRNWIFAVAVMINFICFIFSLVIIFLRLKLNRIFALVGSGLSLLLLLFYGWAFVISRMVGALPGIA